MKIGLIGLGSVLLFGCTDPKATAYEEALKCWEASEFLGSAASDGGDAQLLGVGPEESDAMRRHWNTEAVRLGGKIGKLEGQVNQDFQVLWDRESQRMRNEISISPSSLFAKLVERNKVCMKRLKR